MSKSKRLRVKLRQLRRATRDLWADSIDPVDKLVARVVLRSDLPANAQVRLIRLWLAVR